MKIAIIIVSGATLAVSGVTLYLLYKHDQRGRQQ